LFLDRLDQRYHLLFIVGGLCHGLPHNQLEKRLDRNLRVVPLHESIRPFHDARLRICKVVLGFRLGLGFLAIFTLALGLLSRSLFQRLLGFLNPRYPCFPSLQLFGQFLTFAIPGARLR
jgi:hypothetical protein